MKDFILAALPWVLMGLALAVIAANYARKKEDEKQDGRQLTCMGLGIVFGVAMSSIGLFESHALGISLGALLGLAIGTSIESK